jgi:Bacterial protein of unknown function (DUF899)
MAEQPIGTRDEWLAAPERTRRPTRERRRGMSAFALEDGVVYHTYSAYARGLDALGRVPVARPGAEGAQRTRVVAPSP